ncbi:MAG: alpha/beta hydrolase [Lapillicoccus sp.]
MFEVTLRDGAHVTGQSWGSGPGLVLVQRSLSVRADYAALGVALGDRYTLHVYDRRGHGDSTPRGSYLSLRQEVADLEAVLEETGSRAVLAHSSGALVALELARRRDLDGLALYDPGISLDGSLPYDWVPELLAAIKRRDEARAMAVVSRGFGRPAWMAPLPMWLRLALVRVFLRSRRGRMYRAQLDTGTSELLQVIAHDRGPETYAGIRAPLWLAVGADSPGHYLATAELLHRAVPGSRLEVVKGSRHSQQGVPPALLASLKGFLDECLTSVD